MNKIIFVYIMFFVCGIAYSENKSIELIRAGSSDINMSKLNVELPKVVAKKDIKRENIQNVSQDVVFKFNQLKDKMLNIKNDTTWLRSDMNRLLNDARRIQSTGQNNVWFSYDLRDMAYKMSRWYNDIDRIKWDIRDLINIANKSEQLNKIAKDIEWYAWDIENTFDFSLENNSRELEYVVRSIDPKIIGYDAIWNASDIVRYVRDISYKARDIYWDARELVNKTQP